MTELQLPQRPMFIDEFEPLIGQIFFADCNPKLAAITLLSVKPLAITPGVERQPFILIFHSVPDILLVDGIYAMRCGSFGPEHIFIGSALPPTVGAIPGYYYQAVFN